MTINEALKACIDGLKVCFEGQDGYIDYKNLEFRRVDREGNVLPIHGFEWPRNADWRIYQEKESEEIEGYSLDYRGCTNFDPHLLTVFDYNKEKIEELIKAVNKLTARDRE